MPFALPFRTVPWRRAAAPAAAALSCVSNPRAPRKAAGTLGRRMRAALLGLGTLAAAGCVPALDAGSGGAGRAGDGPVQVALLVPYGSARGSDAVVARSLENAARLAAADLQGARVEITVYPTQGTAAGAQAAAQNAVAAGAQVMLGPLFADNAAAAGVVAAGSGVPVLSFSNNADIAGGNVWVLGNTFGNTAERLMSFAAAQGRNRLMVTHPDTAAGDVARDAIAGAARRTGGQVVAVVPYEFSQQGIEAAIPVMAQQARAAAANAVFLTGDSAGSLPIVSTLLSEAGIGGEAFRYLGLASWDVPAQTLQLPGLQGGYFTLPDANAAAQFRARYQAAYGGAPHPRAGLAYDGVAAVGAIAGQGRTVGRATLTRGSGFAGTGGIFRLREDGTNQRALAVAQVVNGTAQVVSPAPTRFGGAGF
jgi:ABC-type branched-subunit amino acid transport system substrate-binding protein